MIVFDLLVILSVLLIGLGLLGTLIALTTRRWALLKRFVLGLFIYISVYVLFLVAVALLSPQKVLAIHQIRCFDDWCASVERVEIVPTIGTVQADGNFYLVTLQVSSKAKRIRQRALDASVYLIDSQGIRYDPSPQGQHALEAAGQAGQPLNSWLGPGGSFTYTAVFDLPLGITMPSLVITHGAFPDIIIIGSDQSFLHKPTIVRLSIP